MAGIGFELKKVFDKEGFLANIKGFVYASFVTVGPIISCIIALLVIRLWIDNLDMPYMDREVLMASITYAFMFSLIVSSIFAMIMSRYVSDKLYEKKIESILPSLYGALAFTVFIAGGIGGIFYYLSPLPLLFKYLAFVLYMELTIIFTMMVYVSAIKDYKIISIGFFSGLLISIITMFIVVEVIGLKYIESFLFALDLGFFIVMVFVFVSIKKFFTTKNNAHFEYFKYVQEKPSLVWINMFYIVGIYIHNIIYWNISTLKISLADTYILAPVYDMAAFLGMLTILPAMVIFVVKVETSFYETYKGFLDSITQGGRLSDINIERKKMIKLLRDELGFVMQVQFIMTISCIILGNILLPYIGVTGVIIDLFNILSLGYYLTFMMFIVVLVVLYFDDRKSALVITAIFLVVNIVANMITINMGEAYYGTGLFFAGLISFIVGLVRLNIILKNIDYIVFCAQPLLPSENNTKFGKFIDKISLCIIIMLLITGCSNKTVENPKKEEVVVEYSEWDINNSPLNRLRINDNPNIYLDDTGVEKLYITVYSSKGEKKNNHTLEQLNQVVRETPDEDVPVLRIYADSKPVHTKEEANAEFTIRGHSTRNSPYKSYKIRLFDKTNPWKGQKVINLNKHPYDTVKIRNKFCFDYFTLIPDMISLRTQFVQLYVRDMSKKNDDADYVDYGLYTHVEQPNKNFLKKHGLDPNGTVYKAENFEFYRYPEVLKNVDEEDYAKVAFETRLEIKEGKDHTKILKMLDDLNDYSKEINDIIETHFQRDNYMTWLACNMLFGNWDTVTQNFLLYSPQNASTWYFVPWDYDASLALERRKYDLPESQMGIPIYWGQVLHRRFFKDPNNVNDFVEKLNEVYSILNKENTEMLVESYKPIVKEYLFRLPDIAALTISADQVIPELDRFQEIIDTNKKRFEITLQNPMPVFLDAVSEKDGFLTIRSEESYDLQGDDLTYTFIIAKDPAGQEAIYRSEPLYSPEIKIPRKNIEDGKYFLKVVIEDEKGHEQIGLDHYRDEYGEVFKGVRPFTIGTVE